MGLRTVVQSGGRYHLTNPTLVRRCALRWLSKVGFNVTSRTRWATLLEMFESTIGKAMDEADTASGNEPDPSLN